MHISSALKPPAVSKAQQIHNQNEKSSRQSLSQPKDVFQRKPGETVRFAGEVEDWTQALSQGNTERLKNMAKQKPELLTLVDRDGRSSLYLAARNGHTETAEALAKLKPELLLQARSNGSTPLHSATYYGHTETAKALAGLNPAPLTQPDNQGYTPLLCAAHNGHTKTVEALAELKPELLTLRNHHGAIPIHWAAYNGYKETVLALADLKPELLSETDASDNTPLHYAVHNGQAETAQMLAILKPALLTHKNNEGKTPLEIKNAKGMHDLLQSIVDHQKSDDNNKNKRMTHSLLAKVIAAEQTNLIKLLIQEGKLDINEVIYDDFTPLTLAAGSGKTKSLKTLANLGADLTARDENSNAGRTGMQYAFGSSQPESARLLLTIAAAQGNLKAIRAYMKQLDQHRTYHPDSFKVTINDSDVYGQTAMTAAAANGQPDAILALKAFGADLEKKDANGHTPREMALQQPQYEAYELIDLLLKQKN